MPGLVLGRRGRHAGSGAAPDPDRFRGHGRSGGGPFRATILRSLNPGDIVRTGAPIGEALTLPEGNTRDLLMVAGATGLAPFRRARWQQGRGWTTPAVSEDSNYAGERNLVGDVAAAQDWTGRIALVCGSIATVEHTTGRLQERGMPQDDIKYEKFATTIVAIEPRDSSKELGEPA